MITSKFRNSTGRVYLQGLGTNAIQNSERIAASKERILLPTRRMTPMIAFVVLASEVHE